MLTSKDHLMFSILHHTPVNGNVMHAFQASNIQHHMKDKTNAIPSNDSKLIDFNRIEKNTIAFDGWPLPLFIAHYQI